MAPTGPKNSWNPLTARELEVLELMVNGFANREIPGALGISSHIAKFHVVQIFVKTGSATCTRAARPCAADWLHRLVTGLRGDGRGHAGLALASASVAHCCVG
jgi:DNA-binding CsgD family transcriptional regulator